MEDQGTARRLPSIRSRVVTIFIVFGLVFCLLATFIMAVSTSWQAGIFSLLLILLLVVVSGWHVASYMTRDVRQLSRHMSAVTRRGLVGGHEVVTAFEPMNEETLELTQAFRRYVEEVDRLQQNLQYEIAACNGQVNDATFILSNFMYNIAHTLRTPLNAIRWTVETLKNEEPGNITEAQRELLDKLEYSSINLSRVADELQDTLIVIRQEPLAMKRRRCSLPAIVEEVMGEKAVAARRKRVRLAWEKEADALPDVVCDPRRIRQAISILVDNAVHYTRPGHAVRVSAHVIDEAPQAKTARALHLPGSVRNCVALCIRDEGMGIPHEEQSHIFQPFYRGSNARDVWVDGRGIGLTLAKAIIQQSGGEIWFVSRVGYGSTFCFSLPAIF